jgi:hypothetical protein
MERRDIWSGVVVAVVCALGCKSEPPPSAEAEALEPAAPQVPRAPAEELELAEEEVGVQPDVEEASAKAKEGVLKSYLLARTTMRYVDSGGKATLGGHGFSIVGQEGGSPGTGPALVERLAAEDERRRGKEASHRGMKDKQESP